MKGFKLIAILPLKGCGSKFSKNLVLGFHYQFYHEYEILLNEEKSWVDNVKINPQKAVPENLYKLKNNVSVNFSAVVGKNGSGKSTLFELLYYIVYILGTRQKLYGHTILKKAESDLQLDVEQLNKEIEHLRREEDIPIHDDKKGANEEVSALSSKKDINLYVLNLVRKYALNINTNRADSIKGVQRIVSAELKSKISDIKYEIEQAQKMEHLLDTAFNVSVIYEVDSSIREVHCNNGQIEHNKLFAKGSSKIKTDSESFKLDDFFYSISLNYSLHSLNARTLGKWINKLFHKNDAYRTPLVINPMRVEGNFDINKELKLSMERLMSTLVFDLHNKKENWLLDKYKVNKFIFTPKLTTKNPVASEADFSELFSFKIISHQLGIKSLDISIPYGEIAINYLDSKIAKVEETYDFLLPQEDNDGKGLETFIKEDRSHITKKIRQSMNYLKVAGNESNQDIWAKTGGEGTVELSTDEMNKYLELFTKELIGAGPAEVIEYALPSFFNIDFEFINKKNDKIKLSEMSSGEQQMIFNTNAILYHLYNIQSVHKNASKTKNESHADESPRPAYKNVNIVLDEMELYYHPDLQRQLVKNLMDSFQTLNEEKGISSINVCILTHSPFILSDIPIQNILRLDMVSQGLQSPGEQTFAANIHDLLRKDFLLKEGFMGAFASAKILAIIDYMNSHSSLSVDEKKSLLARQNEFDQGDRITQQECKDLIALVGEPALSVTLTELYSLTFPEERFGFIDEQINVLETLKKKLISQL